MRTVLSFSIVSAALLSSIATSPPTFSVYERVKGKHTVDRGDDLELGIDVLASAEALPQASAPPPVPVDEVDTTAPIDRAPEFEPTEDPGQPQPGGLTSELDVILEIDSRGLDPDDTEVLVALWRTIDEDEVLVDEIEADVTSGEPAYIELFAGGVFATCDIQTECLRSFSVTIEQTGEARLRVRHEVSAHIRGTRGTSAPREARIDLDVYAR